MSKQSKQPISKTPWFVITLLIVFFPVGLYHDDGTKYGFKGRKKRILTKN